MIPFLILFNLPIVCSLLSNPFVEPNAKTRVFAHARGTTHMLDVARASPLTSER